MKLSLSQRIFNYENWISSGCKGELPEDMQKELLKLFSESKVAYTFYRNNLFRKAIETERDDLKEFYSFFTKNIGLSKFQELIKHYSNNNTLDNFEDKRMNVVEIVSENSRVGITHNLCFLYQGYYEIETILLVIASIAILNKENRLELNHDNLKDSSGRLKKGVCIDFIKTQLKEFPILLNLFSLAYNTKLRNTIGHNNYRISNNTVESLDGKLKVNQNEFYESLYNLQKLNNFLIYSFSSLTVDLDQIKDCGILSIGFAFEDKLPVLVIHQLECFFYLDKVKEWLEIVEFNISDNELTTKLNTKTPIKGLFTDDLNTWFNALEKEILLKVIFQPIVPTTDDEAECIEIDYGKFQICNEIIEKEIKYKKCML